MSSLIQTTRTAAMRERQRIEVQLHFNTPAFLGDAEQKAQWRTPPLKSLIRQWWRIARAHRYEWRHEALREAEGRLLGHAWLQSGESSWSKRAAVQLRLQHSDAGQITQWPPAGARFNKVVTTADGKASVSADLYTGYGALLAPKPKEGRHGIGLRGSAISRDAKNVLRIQFPADAREEIEETLQLIHWFGAVGSRSRNGWGSLSLASEDIALADWPSSGELGRYCRDLADCQSSDWPGAIGRDASGPLVWYSTENMDMNWADTINEVARLKVAVRRIAKAYRGPNGLGGIHLLGYPAGGDWQFPKWEQKCRMPCPLRFKVGQDDTGCWLNICHTPCNLTPEMQSVLTDGQKRFLRSEGLQMWQAIHAYLDEQLDARDHAIQRVADE